MPSGLLGVCKEYVIYALCTLEGLQLSKPTLGNMWKLVNSTRIFMSSRIGIIQRNLDGFINSSS